MSTTKISPVSYEDKSDEELLTLAMSIIKGKDCFPQRTSSIKRLLKEVVNVPDSWLQNAKASEQTSS